MSKPWEKTRQINHVFAAGTFGAMCVAAWAWYWSRELGYLIAAAVYLLVGAGLLVATYLAGRRQSATTPPQSEDQAK